MFVKTSTSIFRTLSANVRHADRGCRFPKSTVNSPLFLSRVGWAVSVSVSTAIGTNPFLNRDFSNFAMYPCASYASPIMDRGHYKRQGQGGAFFNEQVVASRISKSCALLSGISRHVRSDYVISVEHRGESSIQGGLDKGLRITSPHSSRYTPPQRRALSMGAAVIVVFVLVYTLRVREVHKGPTLNSGGKSCATSDCC